MHRDFEPQQAFNEVDQNKDGSLDSFDIVQFMRNNYNKLTLNEAEMIIKEYDADGDGTLSFEEFTMFALPSTN
jgi:Ca2+-binding EF-hand superfamily protein